MALAAAKLATAARRGAEEVWARLCDRKTFTHRFAISLALGLGIESLLHALHDSPRLTAVEDDAMDWAIALYRGSEPKRPEPVGFTVVDIDEATFEEWGGPPLVPRDRLARLIQGVAAANPLLLVVDVDLSGPALTEADPVMAQAIAKYEEVTRAQLGRVPPLLLVQGFRTPESDSRCVVPRASFLDAAIRGSDSIAVASALFQVDGDRAIRRWRLWERVCESEAGELEHAAVPSLQLLIAALLAEPDVSVRSQLARLDRELASAPPYIDVAAGPAERHATSRHVVQVGDVELSVPASRPNQRILYRYPSLESMRPEERHPLDMVRIVSAAPLARGVVPNRELFEGRIAVIGGSFAAGDDIHPTPLGEMPGALVIVNAIDSLAEFGEIREPPRGWLVAILVLEVLLISTMFAWFDHVIAPLMASTVLLITLIPVSLLLFRDGYWVNFALPLIAVQAHQVVEKIRDLRSHLSGGPAPEGP